jgi:hypothetical protein
MKTSIWYHNEDMCPKKSGHYLAYKLPTFGDDSEGYGLYYWNDYYADWQESMAPHSHSIKVSIWSHCPEHDPNNHMTLQPVPAEILGKKYVKQKSMLGKKYVKHRSLDYQYNVIRGLVR